MPLFVLVLLLLTQSALEAAPDEIDQWLKGFNSMSLNGEWPSFDLPTDASPEKVVEAFAKTQTKTTDSAQYEGYRVVETKRLDQSNSLLGGYTLVLIASSRGSKTMLFLRNYHSGWLVRPYYITTVP